MKTTAVLVLAVLCAGCVTQQRSIHGNGLGYLDIDSAPTAMLVTLQTPIRVGVAFAPTDGADDGFSAERKQHLLERIADGLLANTIVGAIEIIPSAYLASHGTPKELDRLRTVFRITQIIVISYDQVQFSDTGAMGLTYWAYGVPAYFVKGEKNETRTSLDAVALDIPTRTPLFHASGQSSMKGSSTLMGVNKALRERSSVGFDKAVGDLITDLAANLRSFEASVKDGTIDIHIAEDGSMPFVSGSR